MSELEPPSEPERVADARPRGPYEPPTITEYGTLEDLTRGAFGPIGDEGMTGTQP